ncbi:Capsule polysaccharide biosynthesis protein [compost metagenome]
MNIAKLQQRYGFKITQENTLDLIKASTRVITINSTVGLEAKLYRKRVEVLGRAFYAHFSHEQLKKYLHRYLFTGIEARATTPVPVAVARAFIRH